MNLEFVDNKYNENTTYDKFHIIMNTSNLGITRHSAEQRNRNNSKKTAVIVEYYW